MSFGGPSVSMAFSDEFSRVLGVAGVVGLIPEIGCIVDPFSLEGR